MAMFSQLLDEVCEIERRSHARNQKLIKKLEDLEECVVRISTQTEELRQLREQYLSQMYNPHGWMTSGHKGVPLTSTPVHQSGRHADVPEARRVEETRGSGSPMLPHHRRPSVDSSTFDIRSLPHTPSPVRKPPPVLATLPPSGASSRRPSPAHRSSPASRHRSTPSADSFNEPFPVAYSSPKRNPATNFPLSMEPPRSGSDDDVVSEAATDVGHLSFPPNPSLKSRRSVSFGKKTADGTKFDVPDTARVSPTAQKQQQNFALVNSKATNAARSEDDTGQSLSNESQQRSVVDSFVEVRPRHPQVQTTDGGDGVRPRTTNPEDASASIGQQVDAGETDSGLRQGNHGTSKTSESPEASTTTVRQIPETTEATSSDDDDDVHGFRIEAAFREKTMMAHTTMDDEDKSDDDDDIERQMTAAMHSTVPLPKTSFGTMTTTTMTERNFQRRPPQPLEEDRIQPTQDDVKPSTSSTQNLTKMLVERLGIGRETKEEKEKQRKPQQDDDDSDFYD